MLKRKVRNKMGTTDWETPHTEGRNICQIHPSFSYYLMLYSLDSGSFWRINKWRGFAAKQHTHACAYTHMHTHMEMKYLSGEGEENLPEQCSKNSSVTGTSKSRLWSNLKVIESRPEEHVTGYSWSTTGGTAMLSGWFQNEYWQNTKLESDRGRPDACLIVTCEKHKTNELQSTVIYCACWFA